MSEHTEHGTHQNHHHAAPEEPKSPAWLPVVGIVFFLLAGLALFATSSDGALKTGATPEAVQGAK